MRKSRQPRARGSPTRQSRGDEPHRERGDQIGLDTGRAELAGYDGREHEDAGPDRDIDDACGEAHRADGAGEAAGRVSAVGQCCLRESEGVERDQLYATAMSGLTDSCWFAIAPIA
jgi:hypothetical protein